MKNFMKANILAVLTISLVLILNTGNSNIYGQNFSNQTSGQNNTQQLGQQLEQANQQLAQANQTQQQVSNQAQQQLSNQTQPTQANQSKQQDTEMNEKLLNFTNTAILALNDDNTSAAQDSLVQIQNELINASGKQVVVIPAPAVSDDGADD